MPIALLWDGVAGDGDSSADVRSICVTASASAFSIAASYLLEHAKKYPSRTDEEETDRALWGVNYDIQAQLAHIAHQLVALNPCGSGGGGDEDLRLRTNPDNDCQLQQSIDGGISWTTVFDQSLCVPNYPPVGNQVTNFYQTFYETVRAPYENFAEHYTDSITDLFADLGYDSSGEDANRDLALCYAAKLFVESTCASALKWYDDLDGLLNGVKIAAAIATGIGALVGLATGGLASPGLAALASGATYAAAGIAIGAALGESIYTLVTSVAREDFEDEDAKAEVACAIYTMLRGSDVNADVFKIALDDLTFEGAAIGIGAYSKLLMHEDATYATFAQVLDLQYRSARAGLLPDCDCAEPGAWEEVTDAVTGENVDKWSIVDSNGQYVTGQYFETTARSYYPPGNTYRALFLGRTVDAGCTLTYAKIEGVYSQGTVGVLGDVSFVFTWGSFSTAELLPDVPDMPTELIGLNEAGGAVSFGYIAGVNEHSPTDPGGYVRITKITLQGTGTPPS